MFTYLVILAMWSLQVEFHPHYRQIDLKKYCDEHGIHFQAYSSLGTTVEGKANPLLNDEVIVEIAKIMGKTPAQILLRWAVQQGIGNHWLNSLYY